MEHKRRVRIPAAYDNYIISNLVRRKAGRYSWSSDVGDGGFCSSISESVPAKKPRPRSIQLVTTATNKVGLTSGNKLASNATVFCNSTANNKTFSVISSAKNVSNYTTLKSKTIDGDISLQNSLLWSSPSMSSCVTGSGSRVVESQKSSVNPKNLGKQSVTRRRSNVRSKEGDSHVGQYQSGSKKTKNRNASPIGVVKPKVHFTYLEARGSEASRRPIHPFHGGASLYSEPIDLTNDDDDVIICADEAPFLRYLMDADKFLNCSNSEDALCTVVSNVREAHECEELGEMQELSDDVKDMLDGMVEWETTKVRCLSLLRMANRCGTSMFRTYLRAHDVLRKVFTIVQDVLDNSAVSLCLSVVLYKMSHDCMTALDQDSSTLKAFVSLLRTDVDCGREVAITTPTSGKRAGGKERGRRKRKGSEKQQKTNEPLLEEMRRTGFELCRKRINPPCEFKNIQEFTIKNLLMSALISSTTRTISEWCKNEMRILGGLNLIVDEVIRMCSKLRDGATSGRSDDLALVLQIDRYTRLLDNLSMTHDSNQSCISAYKSSALILSLIWLVKTCLKNMKSDKATAASISSTRSVDPVVPEKTGCKSSARSVDPVVPEKTACRSSARSVGPEKTTTESYTACFLSSLRLLVNLSEINEVVADMVYADIDLLHTLLESVLNYQELKVPHQHKLDFHIMAYSLMTYVVRISKDDGKTFVCMKMPLHIADSSFSLSCSTSLEALCSMFSSYYQSICDIEAMLEDFEEESDLLSNEPYLAKFKEKAESKSADRFSKQKGNRKSLQKKTSTSSPGRNSFNQSEDSPGIKSTSSMKLKNMEEYSQAASDHMDACFVSAYCALLIGMILACDPNLANEAMNFLPEKSFASMLKMVKRFRTFMSSVTAGSDSASDEYIEKIMNLLEELQHILCPV